MEEPLTVRGYLDADERCFMGTPVRVVGWVEPVRDDDVASPMAYWVLRSDVVTADSVASLFFSPALDATLSVPDREQWAEVTVRRDVSHAHCGWQLNGPEPPIQVCFALASASAITLLPAPAAALSDCPRTDQPIGVNVFSLLPASCFGSATLTLTGWMGIAYVIGDWDTGWSLEPNWLWSPGIGQFTVLSPDSNALNPLRVALTFKPGSGLGAARVDRWVNLSGHLSDPAAAGCRWVYYEGYDPVTGAFGAKPDDASARDACRASFVVDAITDSSP